MYFTGWSIPAAGSRAFLRRVTIQEKTGKHYGGREEFFSLYGGFAGPGEYLLERQERELTISCAGRILAEIKRMQMTGDEEPRQS